MEEEIPEILGRHNNWLVVESEEGIVKDPSQMSALNNWMNVISVMNKDQWHFWLDFHSGKVKAVGTQTDQWLLEVKGRGGV